MGKDDIRTKEDIKLISKQARITRILQSETDIETWIGQEYKGQEIDIAHRNLAIRKAHGIDGIPG